MMSFSSHPMLKAVCLSIACDNGLINRFVPEATYLNKAERIVFALAHPPEALAEIEAWIATLTEDERETLAAGEHNDVQALIARAPHGAFLDDILNDAFEGA